MMNFKASISIFIILLGLGLTSCSGSLVDPSLLEEAAEPVDPGLQDEVIPLGLSLITFKGGDAVRGGMPHKIAWFIKTDPAYTEMDPGFYLSKIELSKDNGLTWQVPAGGDDIPGVSDAEIAYNWSIPLSSEWEGDGFKVRVTVRNTKGHRHNVVSGSWTIDNHLPYIIPNTLKLNESTSSPFTSKSSNVNISFEAEDTLSDVASVCFKLTSVSQPAEDDTCWRPLNILGITPAKKVEIKGLSQFLGFVGGSFTIYTWVKDRAGNASELISLVGDTSVDSRVINYTPGNSVSFDKFVVSNSDSSDRLPALSEMKINASHTKLIIKWAISVAPGGALATDTPISLEYTDENTYTPIAAPGLTNGINGNCTLTDSATGCFEWTVPSQLYDQYFKVRIRVKDDGNFIYTAASNAINTGNFRGLAGNTDSGIGGSASQAVFNIVGGGAPERTDTGTLLVAEDGRIYIKDSIYGILYIDPNNGSLRVFLPVGTSSVDGDISVAKTLNLRKIGLDYQGNLIILEKNRLRKITRTVENDVEKWTVSTLAGGGSTTNRNLSGIDAKSFNLNVSGNQYDTFMTPLPNGDVYFNQTGMNTSSGSTDIRVYKADKQKVYPVLLSGKGVEGQPYRAIDDLNVYSTPGISFNPVTSIVDSLHIRWCKSIPGSCTWYASNLNPRTGVSNGTGVHYPHIMSWGNHAYVPSRRGELYAMGNVVNSGLFKVNTATRQWARIIGNGIIGQCADGTLAAACPIDITDSFITSDNIIFFMDRNQMRVLGSDGRIATVFGQSKSKGDNGDPLLARFNRIEHLGVWGPEDNIITMDINESVMREFRPGGTMATIAGNRNRSPSHGWNSDRSSQTAATAATLTGLFESYANGFVVDKTTGEPISYTQSGSGYSLSKLVRNPSDPMNGKWYRLVHGGAKTFTQTGSSSCDGTSNVCAFSGQPPLVSGWIPPLEIDSVNVPAQALVSSHDIYNSNVRYRCHMKSVQTTNGLISHFMGNGLDCAGSNGSSNNFPVDGVNMSSSSSGPYRIYEQTASIYYEPSDAMLMAKYDSRRIVKIPINRDATTKAITGAGSLSTYLETTNSFTSFNYLVDLSGQEIVVYCGTDGVLRKHNTVTGATEVLPLPPKTTCSGRTMAVSADKRKVIFPYMQNGIYGVAEYLVVE